MTPKLNVIPSAIKLTINDANTTTQPQPPSGGLASEISNDDDEDEDDVDEVSDGHILVGVPGTPILIIEE